MKVNIVYRASTFSRTWVKEVSNSYVSQRACVPCLFTEYLIFCELQLHHLCLKMLFVLPTFAFESVDLVNMRLNYREHTSVNKRWMMIFEVLL